MSRPVPIRSGLALLIILSLALAAGTWRTFGHTWDEPEHLAAGLELLDRGKYEYDTEHPPLARLCIALGPWLAGAHSFGTPPPSGVQEGIDILYDGGHYTRTLILARLGTLPFLALLLLSIWLWARRIASNDVEALLAVALLAAVPPVLGHSALAALDVPGAATILLALYYLQRWMGSAHVSDALWFALTTGVAVATKFSAIPFVFVGAVGLGGLRVMLRPHGEVVPRSRRRASVIGLMLLAAAAPIVLAYGPRSVSFTGLPERFSWVLSYVIQDNSSREQLRTSLSHLRLPETLWDLVEGIMALKAHNDTGHMSYLFGQLKPGGWWYFYLVDLGAKTPLPLLLCGLPGMALLARDGWRSRNSWCVAPALLFVLLLGFASIFSRINIGVRHVLILYPFLALGGAYALRRLWQEGRAPGRIAAAALLLTQLSVWWTAYPDYFPYFNMLVREPAWVLTDSDLDWGGQDLHRLEARLRQLHVPRISLAYQGTADLAREALPTFRLLPPWQPVSGWVAITALARAHDIPGYAWLNRYHPLERVGSAIDLYDIPAGAQPVPAGKER